MNVVALDTTVRALLDDLRNGILALPEFQREWRWSSTKVRDYIDSLYRGYPSGVLLFWQPQGPNNIPPIKEFAIDENIPTDKFQYCVLDGQQRLTALWKVTRGEIKLRFNPLEDSFQVENAVNRQDPHWLPVWEALHWTQGQAVQQVTARFAEEHYEKVFNALGRLAKIMDYPYRVYVLKTDEYEAVVESFVRLNSGVPLRQAELAMATLLLGLPGFYKEEISDLIDELEKRKFSLDMTVIIRFLGAVLGKEARLLRLRKLLSDLRDDEAKLRQAWNEMKCGLELVIDDLQGLGLTRDDIPSVNVLIPMVYYRARHAHISERDRKLLLAWFLLSSAKQRYSGAVETTLEKDLQTLAERGPQGLIEDLHRLPGGLQITEEELEGPYYHHPCLMLMMLTISHYCEGQDLFDREGTPLKGSTHAFEKHHIYPRQYVIRKLGLTPREADELANIAFLTKQSNLELKDTPPFEYLSKVEPSRLERQLIPCDGQFYKPTKEGYYRFLRERRRLLAKAINEYINSLIG